MEPVRTALIGFGHLGRFHAQKIEALESALFIAIVEPTKVGRERAMSEFPTVTVVESIEHLPQEVEAAIVATPTSFHFEICKQLAQKNINIFCEKPITDKLSDALELQRLLEEKKLIFQAGHSERCHEAWDKKSSFKKFLDAGSHIRLDRYAPFKGRATDVDVVNDLMIHDLDLLCFLLEGQPKSVKAQGFKQRTKYWDHAVANLIWENGTQATITVGRGHVHEVRSLEAVSSAGVLRVDLMNNKIEIAHADSSSVESDSYEKRDHLLMEQDAFYQTIRGKRKVMVSLEDGVAAVKLVNAVLESLENNSTVVL